MLDPKTLAPGKEQFECFAIHYRPGGCEEHRYQYHYRAEDGTLFYCVSPTLESARKRRDAWLERKRNQESTAIH